MTAPKAPVVPNPTAEPLAGGKISTVGATVYPKPELVIVNDEILPPALTVAVAEAPTLPGESIKTAGATPKVYPPPCSSISIL